MSICLNPIGGKSMRQFEAAHHHVLNENAARPLETRAVHADRRLNNALRAPKESGILRRKVPVSLEAVAMAGVVSVIAEEALCLQLTSTQVPQCMPYLCIHHSSKPQW